MIKLGLFYSRQVARKFVWGQISLPQQGELLQLYSAEPACLQASLARDLRFVH